MKNYMLPFWEDKDTFYTQENNPTETLLGKILGKGYLESCGPTAAANLVQSINKQIRVIVALDEQLNSYEIPLDEVIMDYFNNPGNFKRFNQVRKYREFKKIPFNEIPQYYPLMFEELFRLRSEFKWGVTFDKVKSILSNKYGVILCFKKPGHYIAVGKVYSESEEIEYRDSWKGNYFPKRLKGTSGFNRRVKWSEIEKNLKNFYITVGVKDED